MRALTIWQPWASLIAIEAKPYEFRSWAAPKAIQGQRIAIHAGARPVRKAEVADLILRLKSVEPWTTGLRREIALEFLERVHASPAVLPLSAVVCTAVLGQPVRASEIVHEFDGAVNDSDREEHANFAWPMRDVQPLLPPIDARGAQGFWEWIS